MQPAQTSLVLLQKACCPHHSVILYNTSGLFILQSLIMARDVDLAWRELADMQQAGLDAALAAKTKSQKSKATKAASESAHHSNAAATGLHPDSNGMHEDPLVLPDQDTASEADAVKGPTEGTHAEANGHLASEENLAANKQLPPATSSVNMSQVGKLPPLSIPCVSPTALPLHAVQIALRACAICQSLLHAKMQLGVPASTQET